MPGPSARRRALPPVTALGSAVGLVGLLLAAGGWWLGWVEVAVVGTVLLAAFATAALLTLGRSAYRVDLTLSEHRVTVGQRAVGRIVVTSSSARRQLPAQIELPVGAGAADFHLPSLGAGASHEDVFAIPTARRAVIAVGPVRSVRGDPLGLLRRRIRWTDSIDLYVHPELVNLAGAASGVLRDLEGQATRVVSDSDMSFHALRDYVAGDDRRHIHWKSTARIGTLMVRQFEDTRRTHTAIALSTAAGDFATSEEFELAVSVAASVGVQALRDQREVTVLAGQGALRTRTPLLLLDDCAGLELGAGRDSTYLAQWVAREAPAASAAVLVTGTVPARSDLRARASRIPVGVRAVILTCSPGAEVEVATQGSLSVAQIGSLNDLPRVLRRVVRTA